MGKRGSGILCHITSLPSPYGIGDLGRSAYDFADFLSHTRQSYWQVLPLHPTDLACGNSPYSSPSAFAGNPLLIDLDFLVESGWLKREAVVSPPPFPQGICHYSEVASYKKALLRQAYLSFKAEKRPQAFETFCQEERGWLEDYALFTAIKHHFGGKSWDTWEKGLKHREPGPLENMRRRLREEVEEEMFYQFLFFTQWRSLKTYCNRRGIGLIGDIPIYVNYDSADVWAHPELFNLDGEKRPLGVAGVPPDYFSEAGQLWGNPTYRWDRLREEGYQWWIDRLSHNLHLYDLLRLDHFRGFVAYWEVPAGETTAVNGEWKAAPSEDFFQALLRRFQVSSFIAEDLGIITPEVREVMERFGFPGMRILQFAFGEDNPSHPYLPHNYIPHSVVYTGTHDNNTVRGWFERETSPEERRRVFRYVGRELLPEEVSTELIRLAMMSVANTVLIPVQDLLGLGEEGRMNRPATSSGNWQWRLLPHQLTEVHAARLLDMTEIYGRANEIGAGGGI